MWLFTVDGFYSAVQDRENPDLIMVRSRQIVDLENLILRLNRLGHWPALTIRTTKGTDYAYRVFMPRSYWDVYVVTAASEINYENFKAAAVAKDDPRRSAAYYQVWDAMKAWQEGWVTQTQAPTVSFQSSLPFDEREYINNPLAGLTVDDLDYLDAWDAAMAEPELSYPTHASPVARINSLLAMGAGYEEVADRLLEDYNPQDLQAALEMTKDSQVAQHLEYALYLGTGMI